jgi:hypothetical protein
LVGRDLDAVIEVDAADAAFGRSVHLSLLDSTERPAERDLLAQRLAFDGRGDDQVLVLSPIAATRRERDDGDDTERDGHAPADPLLRR